MHFKLLFDRDMLAACDLQGRDVVVTIAKVEKGELKRIPGQGAAKGAKKEHKPLISFVGKQKKWVCNVTNGNVIAKLYGPHVEQWIGKQITLYPTTTSVGGVDTECVRVRPSRPSSRKGAGTDPAADFAPSPPAVAVFETERTALDDDDGQTRQDEALLAQYEREQAAGSVLSISDIPE